MEKLKMDHTYPLIKSITIPVEYVNDKTRAYWKLLFSDDIPIICHTVLYEYTGVDINKKYLLTVETNCLKTPEYPFELYNLIHPENYWIWKTVNSKNIHDNMVYDSMDYILDRLIGPESQAHARISVKELSADTRLQPFHNITTLTSISTVIGYNTHYNMWCEMNTHKPILLDEIMCDITSASKDELYVLTLSRVENSRFHMVRNHSTRHWHHIDNNNYLFPRMNYYLDKLAPHEEQFSLNISIEPYCEQITSENTEK
jgi:hypothetical protein